MWKDLNKKDIEKYKKLILAFASLTNVFTQKDTNTNQNLLVKPFINSKFQEKAFAKAFDVCIEDIGNTSFDASLLNKDNFKKYLIGIKTFQFSSGFNKIAQFKANQKDWNKYFNKLQKPTSKQDINSININNEIYLKIAKEIAKLRNLRINSSIENIKGFRIEKNGIVEMVYHVLMPAIKKDKPIIIVGETGYDLIDVDNIFIVSSKKSQNINNFQFSDNKHLYQYTRSDSQLLMKFENSKINLENWEVVYLDEPYEWFENLYRTLYKKDSNIKKTKSIKQTNWNLLKNDNIVQLESYCWKITNSSGEVEKFSGFNSFYGVGSKMAKTQREERINSFIKNWSSLIGHDINPVKEKLYSFLIGSKEKSEKEIIRKQLIDYVKDFHNDQILKDIKKLLFRPINELYIPIPNSRKFHSEHKDFFGKNIGLYSLSSDKNLNCKKNKTFCLRFLPSGQIIESFITQDSGKAIESTNKQSYLGEWILRKVFQLNEFEPLTAKRLNELQINGIRLTKNHNIIDLEFIWITDSNLPNDYFS